MIREIQKDIYEIECDFCGDTITDVSIVNLYIPMGSGALSHNKPLLIIKEAVSLGYKVVNLNECYCEHCR